MPNWPDTPLLPIINQIWLLFSKLNSNYFNLPKNQIKNANIHKVFFPINCKNLHELVTFKMSAFIILIFNFLAK